MAGVLLLALFFVFLGARIQLRAVVSHPSIILLTVLLVALTLTVHGLTGRLTGQRLAGGLLTSAQLGVPSAIVALGLSDHVLSANEAGAIVTAAVVTVIISGAAAAVLARTNTVAAPEEAAPVGAGQT